MTLKYKPTQVKVDNLRVIDFFDEKFIGKMQKHFPNLDFQHFCMYIVNEKESKIIEHLTVVHQSVDDKKNNVATIDVDNPESLEKILKIIEEYKKEKGL
jgi:hypothetical protein